jgi:hypothetical protein
MAAANDPSPTAALTPLKATATVQALCNKANSRLVKLTAHMRDAVALTVPESNSEEFSIMKAQSFKQLSAVCNLMIAPESAIHGCIK